MSTPPPSGTDQNTPTPPQPPGVPTAQPDRGAGLALAGFLCGLVSFSAVMLGALVGHDYPFVGHDLVLDALFVYAHDAVGISGFSGGEGVWLITGVVPVALIGLMLSVRGRHSSSHRWLVIAGVVLSVLALAPFLVSMGVLIVFYLYCSAHFCSV